MTDQSRKPIVVVVGGPNGAGKSTAADTLLIRTGTLTNYINPDFIAKGLNPLAPEAASFAAGRMVLNRIRELAASREDFAFETTLSGLTYATILRKMQKQGYETRMLFLYVKKDAISIARVAERVHAGGHNIPIEDIKRRYIAGLRNFFQTFAPLVDTWRFMDNSISFSPRTVAEKRLNGSVKIYDEELWRKLESEYGR
jgi:predicted ABC-type ATPase